MKKKIHFLTALFIISSTLLLKANSEDTLHIDINKADSIFLKQNLLLIASQFNIDVSNALNIQAKSYPNPTFTAGFDAYDSQNKTPFYIGKQGEKAFEFDQLLLIGGKRKAEIDLAKKNKELAEEQFADLLRNLRYQLHQSFFDLARTYSVLPIYNRQLQLLDELISSHEIQAKKGNVPVKDVIRLKTAYLNLSNDRSDLLKEQLEQLKELRTLLRYSNSIVPQMNDRAYENYNEVTSLTDLIKQAKDNRPDLKSAKLQSDYATINLRLQHRNAIPDLTLNTSYDQAGNAFRNQYLIGVSLPLPLWDRNRGNIKAANYQSQATDSLFKEKEEEVEIEVISSIENMNRSVAEYKKSMSLYSDDFGVVFQGESDNYRKGNISLLEFLDFLESYDQSIADFERIKRDLIFAAEQINYVTASKIY